jgi:hypothetical protein
MAALFVPSAIAASTSFSPGGDGGQPELGLTRIGWLRPGSRQATKKRRPGTDPAFLW